MQLAQIHQDLHDLISQKYYPCVAAVKALHSADLVVSIYSNFGSGSSSNQLAKDLLSFKNLQSKSQSSYLTFVAAYPDDQSPDEEKFEQDLWRELSALWNDESVAGAWDEQFSSDPINKNFNFSFGGSAFFVVGLHPLSSRLARRLPYNALVFNLYSQFQDLRKKGVFDSMAHTIRERDLRFQGSVNPMVELYDNKWEAIQYSGKRNPPDWKCPFTRGISQILKSQIKD